MADIMFVVIGVTASTGLFLGSIITTYCCYKRYRHHIESNNSQLSKQKADNDYLHAVIINQHIARHLRPQSSLSFISNNQQHDMTLMAPSRRSAIYEQQQQQQLGPTILIIENPLISHSATRMMDIQSSTLPSFAYENRSLELGEVSMIDETHS
jgi:hypothetical protein